MLATGRGSKKRRQNHFEIANLFISYCLSSFFPLHLTNRRDARGWYSDDCVELAIKDVLRVLALTGSVTLTGSVSNEEY